MHLQNLYHKKMQMQKNNITCIPSYGCGLVTCTCGNPLNVVEDSDTKDES